ncbi:MAG: hypothetical protein FRX49_01024 [Trebouxia sp. A1-2]|nr:MAG: hypothetical protein FRX49_01024 [Trebouxia sp. A1-2]
MPAALHDGTLDVRNLEQMVAFDGLVLNAVNGNPLQCDSSGLSCMVSDFDGDIRAQTLIETGQKFLKEYASAMNFWWLPVWCRRQQVGGEWW